MTEETGTELPASEMDGGREEGLRETDRQTDRQTDGQTDGQRERELELENFILQGLQFRLIQKPV